MRLPLAALLLCALTGCAHMQGQSSAQPHIYCWASGCKATPEEDGKMETYNRLYREGRLSGDEWLDLRDDLLDVSDCPCAIRVMGFPW